MVDMRFMIEYKDMFNIYNLITKINPDYKLYFDQKNKCFKIINIAKNNQLCLKIDAVMPNTINLLQKSRIENLQKIINYIEKTNEELLNKNKNSLVQNLSDKMLEVVDFSKKVSKISNSDIKKILGEKAC